MLYKALLELGFNKGEFQLIDDGNGVKIKWDTEKEIPTQEQIEAKIKELEAQEKVSNAYKQLQELCDTKSKQAKNFIAGKEVTDEQVRRYEEKYQIAKEYKATGAYADRLKLEADLQGLTVDELADLITQKGDAWNEAIITFNARIEAFRVKVADLIESGEIDKANEIIEKAKDLGADATDEDVKALFE